MTESVLWNSVRDATKVISGKDPSIWRIENRIITPGMFDSFMIRPFPAWIEFKWSKNYNHKTETFHLDHKFTRDQYRFSKEIFDVKLLDDLVVGALLMIGSKEIVAVYSGFALDKIVEAPTVPLSGCLDSCPNTVPCIAKMLVDISRIFQ